MKVSKSQLSYLKRSLPISSNPAVVPRLGVEVHWNALILARVNSNYYVGSVGAEWRDSLYLCFFGAWIRVYTFSHEMA